MDVFVIFLLIRLMVLVSAFPTTIGPTTQASYSKRLIGDSSACTSCNYFAGYVYDDGTWVAVDCNPGQFFTYLDPTYCGCVASTDASSYQVSNAYCESTSLIVTPGTVAGVCGTAQPYCVTILVYPNLDLGTPATMIGCLQDAVTLSYFRATTHAAASAAASTTSTSAASDTTQRASGSETLAASSTRSPPSSSTSSPASSQSSAPSASSSNGNSSNSIALGVGIGLGLPAVLVGLAAWLFPRYRREHQQAKESEPAAKPPQSPPRPPHPGSSPQSPRPDAGQPGTSTPL